MAKLQGDECAKDEYMSEVSKESQEDAEYRKDVRRIIDEDREILDELA